MAAYLSLIHVGRRMGIGCGLRYVTPRDASSNLRRLGGL
jgi:hypothetical protein